MITIDGSFGEGGGQILRSSLALSLVTGKAFGIEKIRAGRKKPGLRRQHETAVNAAAEVGRAEVTGNEIGSLELTFVPQTITAGRYHFSVGTAGSTSLVLQTVLPALLTADAPSTVVLEGGTHNPMSPPYDFLAGVFFPVLERMGAKLDCTLERYGFFPAGGGKVIVNIEPVREWKRIDLLERGSIINRRAEAIVAKLPLSIAERELIVVAAKLGWPEDCLRATKVNNSYGPGNVVMVKIESENIVELCTAFGRKGLPAEKVAGQAAQEAAEYLAADVPVGIHLADQLLIPMALAGGGRFRTLGLTDHTKTNIEVIKNFLDVSIEASAVRDDVIEIAIG